MATRAGSEIIDRAAAPPGRTTRRPSGTASTPPTPSAAARRRPIRRERALLKAQLVRRLQDVIADRWLSQAEAAALRGRAA